MELGRSYRENDEYFLMFAATLLFGFVLYLFTLRRREKKGGAGSMEIINGAYKMTSSSEVNGHCTSEDIAGSSDDVIIVGAGVAGSALAYTLAKDGRRVHVIERDLTEQDRIVGELLQPGGYLKLIELGLEDCVNEIDAQRVFGYALYMDGKNTRLSYPLEKFHADVAGRSFHNGRFIQRMREKAASLPNVRMEQGTVTSLVEQKGTVKGVRYKTKNGQEMSAAYAPLTIVCDGCFSNLRHSLCNPKVDVPSCFVGLILENIDLPHINHGHVILADPSPILFYKISSTEIRCLVDVPGQRVPSIANGELAHYLKTSVAPQIPPELYKSFIAAIDKGKIKTMPNRSMPADPHPTPGALLLGDAFNMRHPLTGGGMTVALSDIVLIRDLLRPLRDLHDSSTLCKYLESFYTLRKPVASTINTLAGALYKVFCASPDKARQEMRDACFDYLSLGGICSEGPIALLSGLNPRPMSLFFHFFAVAIYGVGRLLIPFPSPRKMWLGARLISHMLAGAIVSLLGFAVLYLLGKKNKSNSSALVQTQGNECAEWQPEISENPDIIIVGAGVAGSALACTLGKDGRRVLVIERDLTEPDRIVGELLQPGGYLKLVELGLEDCVNEIDAQQVFGYALFKDGKSTRLSYPLKEFDSDVTGKSFHNGRFIQRMREKAATLANVKLEQGTVTSLIERKGTVKGVHYKTKTGQDMTAYSPLTVVCDGCFSNLRRSLCNPKVEIPSIFVALILKNCQLPYPKHGHVILANPSPILLYRISSTEIRCLVDVPGKKIPSIGNGDMANYLKTLVAPQIPFELYDAFITAIEEGNMKTMANRSMSADPYPTPGALLLGDAFNMRHPLTGGGMTVALSDIVVLRDLLRPLGDLNDAPALCRYLESFYTLRKPMASTINTLAGALYKVFCASPDQARNEMRQACFDYLSLGGIFSNGPVALLSGLNPRPLSLVLHFFSVAIYGVGRLLLPIPSPQRAWLGARLISDASSIIFPIIRAEGIRQMFFPRVIPTYYRCPPSK